MSEDVAEKAAVEAVDINDPSLPVEDLDVNVEADQFTIPTVPEGTYPASVAQKNPVNDIDSLWVKSRTKRGQDYFKTGIEARISDQTSKFDDWPLFDNFVSTLVQESTGTNRIVGILKAGKQQITSRSNVELMRQLSDFLYAKPTLNVVVRWVAYCDVCEKDTVKGEKKFPANDNGGHHNTVDCPKCGNTLTAQAKIDKYLPIEG